MLWRSASSEMSATFRFSLKSVSHELTLFPRGEQHAPTWTREVVEQRWRQLVNRAQATKGTPVD